MPADAMLVLYTDGLTEATRDLAAGEARLRAALLDPRRARGGERRARDPRRGHRGGRARRRRDLHRAAQRRRDGRTRSCTGRSSPPTPARRAPSATPFPRRSPSTGSQPTRWAPRRSSSPSCSATSCATRPARPRSRSTAAAPRRCCTCSTEGAASATCPSCPDDVLSERGRGLYIVSALADDFTVSAGRDGGSHARAVLALSAGRLPPFDALSRSATSTRSPAV